MSDFNAAAARPPPPPVMDRGPSAAPAKPAAAEQGATERASTGPSAVARQLQTDSFEPASAARERRWYDANDRFEEKKIGPTLSGKDEAAQARRAEEAAAREKATDGKFVGPRGISDNKFEAGAFRPADGKVVSNKPIYFTNGINTTAAEHARAAEALAEKVRRPVFAVHNATEGAGTDVGQSIRQKLLATETPSSRTLTKEINESIARGKPIEVWGHSQGAIDVSNSINAASRELYGQGLKKDQVEQKLGLITAQTFGGASLRYADGPKYTHNYHQDDWIAREFGLGGPASGWIHPGRGATLNLGQAPVDDAHAFRNYMDWAVRRAPTPS